MYLSHIDISASPSPFHSLLKINGKCLHMRINKTKKCLQRGVHVCVCVCVCLGTVCMSVSVEGKPLPWMITLGIAGQSVLF